MIHWEELALRAFLADHRRADRLAFACLVALVALVAGAVFAFGCSPQSSCAWDAAFLLDGAWRLLGGQRPHVDFYSPLGAVPLGLTALGMWLAGPCAGALGYGYALVLPLVTWAAWMRARRRLPALPALVFALLVGFTLIATHYPGHPFHDTTYAAQYNRLGSALLCLVLIHALLPPRDGLSRREKFVESLGSGVVLALLLFTKITYFVMGAFAVALGALLFGGSHLAWTPLLGAFAAVSVAALGYLGFDLPAFAADMKRLADVQRPADRLRSLANAFRWNRVALGMILLMLALVVRPMRKRRGRGGQPGWGRTAAVVLALIGVGAFLYSTDGIAGTPPAFALAGLVLAESFRRRCAPGSALAPDACEAAFKYLLACMLATYLAGIIVVHGGLSVVYSFAWSRLHAGRPCAPCVVRSTALRDMPLPPQADERGLTHDELLARVLRRDPDAPALTSCEYACWVNDGLALLREHVDAGSRVFVMDWVNPFSFALGLPSPRGGALYWHAGRVFDAEHHPSAVEVFAEVTLVMVPKRAIQPASKAMLERVYGPTLVSEFEPLGESGLWTLYGRRRSLSAARQTGSMRIGRPRGKGKHGDLYGLPPVRSEV